MNVYNIKYGIVRINWATYFCISAVQNHRNIQQNLKPENSEYINGDIFVLC